MQLFSQTNLNIILLFWFDSTKLYHVFYLAFLIWTEEMNEMRKVTFCFKK